jgi:uncharacterized protein (TIGR01244 family)
MPGCNMRHTFTIVLIFLAAQFIFALPANVVPNFQNPAAGIYTAGQPTGEGFDLLAAKGLRTVINVLPESYCVPDEPATVTGKGMTYRSVPFDTSNFRMETVEHFADVLKSAKKPVLIHCSTGNHAAGMWFAYRILFEDAALEQALTEARIIGLRPELEEKLVGPVLAARRER